jgi:hypothetical protein
MAASAFGLLYGLNGDSPISPENDEFCYAPVAVHIVCTDDPNPHWFVNPASTLIYPLAGYYYVLRMITGEQFIDPHHWPEYLCAQHMDTLIKWPRLSSVLFVLLSEFFLYLLGRKWLGKRTALLGVLFYALSPLVVYYGQILRPDSLANFLIVMSLLLLGMICQSPTNLKLGVFLGAINGLALSTRFFCLALVAPQLALFGITTLKAKSSEEKRSIIISGVLSLIVCGVVFLATSPFVFLDFQQVVKDLSFEAHSEFVDLTGLGPLGNFNYYWTDASPAAIGMFVTAASIAGCVLCLLRPSLQTVIYLVLLVVLFVGTCINPRHWGRWILPMLPLMCLFAGLFFDRLWLVLERVCTNSLPPRRAKALAALSMVGCLAFAYFVPFKRLLQDQWQKGRLSALALAFPFIKEHIPPHTKIACDSGWVWPERDNYNVTEGIWRPDFVPPRPHKYYMPEDLAKEGFEYMIVETWNRRYYQWNPEAAKKYARECNFYLNLRKHAPLIFYSAHKNNPYILGEQVPDCVTPIEIYDLRPLATGKLPSQEFNPQE